MTGTTPPPGWYTDSNDPSSVRWWDGSAWTRHTRPHPGSSTESTEPARSVLGRGPLYEVQELLVIEQPPKGNAASYVYVDADGHQLGSVHQTDEHGRVGVTLPPKQEQATAHFRFFDATGAVLACIEQANNSMGAIFKPLITISDANRRPVGAIRADTWGLGRNRSSFYVGDNRVGGLSATSWLSSTHKVTDGDKREIAEIVKREFGNNPLPDIPADGDSYWLHRPHRVSEPLGTLVLLAPFAVDHAFHPTT